MMRSAASPLIFGALLLLVGVCPAEEAGTIPVVERIGKSGSGADLNWQFRYDDAGRITKVIDPAGQETKIHYTLDEHQRIRRMVKELPDASRVAFEFDHLGRRIGMADAAGTVRYEYDGFNRLTAVRREAAPVIAYTYDTSGRLSSIDAGGGLHTKYAYDFLGRLARIETPAGSISYEHWDGQGKVIRTLPNGIRTHWESQPDGRLTAITHVAKNDAILAQFTYSYRPDGLVNRVKEWWPQGERIITYDYDTAQQLTTVSDSQSGRYNYRYDKLGTLTGFTAPGQQTIESAFDWAGRMMQHNGQTSAYDAAGNITAYTGTQGKIAFAYTPEKWLGTVQTAQDKIQYRHDGDGRLIARSVGSTTTAFIPDPLSDSGRPLVTLHGDGKRELYVWEGRTPVAAVAGSEAQFFLHDHLGSVRSVSDRSGTFVQRFDYTPFGAPIGRMAAGNGLRPAFAGKFLDPNVSLYLTRSGTYDPNLGRLLQNNINQPLLTVAHKQERTNGGRHCAWCEETGLGQVLTHPLRLFDANYAKQWYVQQADYAKQWYAQQAERALSSATGTGIAAGLEATAWDLIGGLIPGKRANEGQGYAQILWSLFPAAGGSQALRGFGAGRTFVSSLINAAEGNRSGAALDIVSLVGTRIALEAEALPFKSFWTKAGQQSQQIWGFADPQVMNQASRLKTGSRLITAFGIFKNAVKAAGIPGDNGPAFMASTVDARTDDNRKKVFFFPPGGGGGGGGGDGGGALSPLSPTPVGGVYLRGAGEALKHLGPLKGVALDEKTGRLVLLSEEQGEIDLPPLRLDEVVTVFRSVYEHGEAPFVSIDPNPKDPLGPLMLVRHGKATQDTYVGWVLFEGDRVMKGYSLGYDNITREPINSRLQSYQDIIKLGFSTSNGSQKDPIWERFWIVPVEVSRRQASQQAFTLLDVPLKVCTQRMRLQRGKLVPATSAQSLCEDATSTPPAKAFSKWFTQHYAAIADESRLLPKNCGIDSPVAFFAELQRLAVITAIAERLRDQGVPFPAWMRGYPVKPCPVAKTTPTLTVEASQTKESIIQTQRIYGGVNLAPADEAVHTATADPEVQALAPVLAQAVDAAPLLTPVAMDKDGKRYRALGLPGNDTQALGANRLAEIDLIVPVQRGTELRLVRHFHSFFAVSGALGHAWTPDLPRLEAQRQPVRRTEDKVEFKTGYQLTSPLNSYAETFSELRFVPELKGQLLVPDRAGNILGLASAKDERIGLPTQVVLFRDGRRWHFDPSGDLAAVEETPLTVVYRRDETHRLRRIEGWYGKNLRADIRLEYDDHGRLTAALGSNGETIRYIYDATGALTRVEGPAGIREYRYQDGLVTAIVQDGAVIRQFEYAQCGELRRERGPDGAEITYHIASAPEGVEMTAARTAPSDSQGTVRYDTALRPVSRTLEDGARVQWRYDDRGGVETRLTSPQDEETVVSRSPDGDQEIWRLPGGGTYALEYDAGGRVTSVREGDRQILRQQWLGDGRLATSRYETAAMHPEYREDGVLTGVLITPPDGGPQFSRWLHIQYDELGRIIEMKDFSGAEITIGYDATGEPAIIVSKRGGVEIKRDAKGKIQTVQTSWGEQRHNTYDKTGSLKQIEQVWGEARSVIEFAQGKPIKVRQFDGGEVSLSYYDKSSHQGQIKQIQAPDDVVISYAYDSADRVSTIDYGGVHRIEYQYDGQGRLTGLRQAPTVP